MLFSWDLWGPSTCFTTVQKINDWRMTLNLAAFNVADVSFMSLSAGHHQGHCWSNNHCNHPLNIGTVTEARRVWNQVVTKESSKTTSGSFFVQKVNLTFRYKNNLKHIPKKYTTEKPKYKLGGGRKNTNHHNKITRTKGGNTGLKYTGEGRLMRAKCSS